MTTTHHGPLTTAHRRPLTTSHHGPLATAHCRPRMTAPAAGLMRRAGSRQQGTALVELAFVLPVLAILLFGTIDFGWTFAKVLDVKHGAREGARLVAVNYNPDPTSGSQAEDIAEEVCQRMGGAEGVIVTLSVPAGQAGVAGSVGQEAEVNVSREGRSLTGLFSALLDGRDLDSTVSTRIEVKATWATGYDDAVRWECAA